MAIVEIIGSISLAIVLISAVTFTIIHIKNKQNDITYIHNHSFNNIKPSKHNSLSSVLPFERFNEVIPMNFRSKPNTSKINVIDNNKISSSSIIYDVQWTSPSNKDIQPNMIHSSSNIVQTSGFEQGDTLSYNDQTVNVRNLINKFESNSMEKIYRNENQTDSNSTKVDNQIARIDFNQNQQKISYDSSISNLDVTIPSNLSSSIDLEQFECVSTTSNLSEILNNK